MCNIEQSLWQVKARVVAAPPRERRFVMWSQRKEFCCDPTSTTDAGRPPDPALFSDHDSAVSVRRSGVCQALRQTTGSTRCRAHSPLPVVPDQGKEGVDIHLRNDDVGTSLVLPPYSAPEGLHRTDSVSAARTKAATDFEP